MRRLSAGISTFEKIKADNAIYVDKSEKIYSLVQQGSSYLLCRPRKFGKSLFLSTLESLFQGKKDHFMGLWITKNTNYSFDAHTILKLDFSERKFSSKDDLEKFLIEKIDKINEQYNLNIQKNDNCFRYLESALKIIKDKTKKNTVILIDEYDRPVIDNVKNQNVYDDIVLFMNNFFETIRSNKDYTRFIMITGTVNLSNIPIISIIPNTEDVSISTGFSDLCGFTIDEIKDSFHDHIVELAKTEKLDNEHLLQKIKQWYGGYRFSEKELKVCNPYSILLLMKNCVFKNYWPDQNNLKTLIKHIEGSDFNIMNIDDKKVGESAFIGFDFENVRSLPLLFQSGYTTITDVIGEEFRIYKLGYPNLESSKAFFNNLLEFYSGISNEIVQGIAWEMRDHLYKKDLDNFCESVKIFFLEVARLSKVEIKNRDNVYRQTLIYLIMKLCGFEVRENIAYNDRIDGVIEFQNHIYILEFRIGEIEESEVEQANRKKYYHKYLFKNKKTTLVRINFDTTTNNITNWASADNTAKPQVPESEKKPTPDMIRRVI